MLNSRFALFAMPLLASCYYEPPREYTVPVVIPIDNTTPPASNVIATGAPISDPVSASLQCVDLACDGDFAVSGRISASSFLEGAPLIYNGTVNGVFSILPNTTTVIVYAPGPPIDIELPLSTEAPGRIVRIKVMGVGGVNIKGHLDPMTNQPENVDNAPSMLIPSIISAPPPAITLQAYVDEFVPPGAPKRSGWAVLSVYP